MPVSMMPTLMPSAPAAVTIERTVVRWLAEAVGLGAVYLRREDLNHTGAHKINNTIGQALLARRMGKPRVIAETGAGQHGVATATVAARFGMECIVYMGSEDVGRQAANVYRMKLLGAQVVPVESMGDQRRRMNSTASAPFAGAGLGLAGCLNVEATHHYEPIRPMTMLSSTSRLIELVTGGKAPQQAALVRWHYEPQKKTASILQIVHDRAPCNAKGEGDFFNSFICQFSNGVGLVDADFAEFCVN